MVMVERDSNPTQGFKATSEQLGDWESEKSYWRENWSTRPYVSADRGFEFYSSGYRYGFESAHKHGAKQWADAEGELRSGWDKYEHRGEVAWEHIKEAVRDGWNRIAHRE
jgi:hypothetical protein